MSLATNIKRLFGFGDSDNDDGLLSDVNDTLSVNQGATAAESDAESESSSEAFTMPEISEKHLSAIFDSVVRCFNDSLPEFLSGAVDAEKQKQYLYDALDRDAKDYLALVASQTVEFAKAQVKQQNEANNAEMTRLREETHRLETQRSSIKEQQLSSDRQRRALSERVKDLEAQIASFEAECEQFRLENKSLLNKLKVADVQPAICEELTTENNRLKALLAEQGKPDFTQEEFEAVKTELAGLKTVIEMKDEANRTNLTMLNDLQHELVAEKNAHQTTLKRLEEATLLAQDVAEIREQMSTVENVIGRRDEKINQLKNSNRDLRKQNTKLKDELQALRLRQSEPSLFATFNGESADTNSVVEEPCSHYGNCSDLPEDPSSAKRISPDDLAEIDDEFESTGWLVSMPADGRGLKTELSDSEFGYHEPPRKSQPPCNDAQLSLF